MAKNLGLDPAVVRAKLGGVSGQLGTLHSIANEVTITHRAALQPQNYGIEPGEKTVTPWSIASLAGAKADLVAAHAAAIDLVSRAVREVDFQVATSNSSSGIVVTAIGTVPKPPSSVPPAVGPHYNPSGPSFFDLVQAVRDFRTRFIAGPRNILQAAQAIRVWSAIPSIAKWSFVMPSTWLSVKEYRSMSDFFMGPTIGGANRFTRVTYQMANVFKADWWWTKGGNALLNTKVGQWLPGTANVIKNGANVLKNASIGVGKVFGVVGIGMSAYSLVDGIVGMTDGDVSSEDAWKVADGAVGLICGVGSLMPPPVGVVFAAVGGAYAIGRWLFGADESGKTGIDHISSFAQDTAKNVTNFAKDTVNNAAKVIDDLWPF